MGNNGISLPLLFLFMCKSSLHSMCVQVVTSEDGMRSIEMAVLFNGSTADVDLQYNIFIGGTTFYMYISSLSPCAARTRPLAGPRRSAFYRSNRTVQFTLFCRSRRVGSREWVNEVIDGLKGCFLEHQEPTKS